jgi:hypothetical protein
MATNISPGVYSKIIDLSTYVQAVPGTIGFICALTEKGRDNELLFIGSRSELISEFGEPDINTYGANYGQGLYMAYNYLGESGSLYFMRCLPDDAAFSNLRIDVVQGDCDSSATVSIAYVDSLNTEAEIETNMSTQVGTTYRLCMLYPIGRGEYYNGLGVRFTSHTNPLLNGVYVMDVYEKQSDGQDVIIESFEVSFDPAATDTAGASIYIEDILETYSSVLRAKNGTSGYNIAVKVFDKDIGTVSVNSTVGSATLTDDKQDFSSWETSAGCATYMIIAKDGRGKTIYGFMGAASGDDDETISVYDNRNLDSTSVTVVQQWLGDVSTFDVNSTITYEVKRTNADISTAFTSSVPKPLKKGSDGSLKDASGDLVTAEATSVLANGYAGTIDPEVLDTDSKYFSLVFDCGYPSNVKTQIVTLSQTREDCIGILDNGDNASYTVSINSRQNTHTYNTFYAAIYESYDKVYDTFTGKDVWFSPIFHMSYILPRNDAVSELWFAAAGFNRATISTIKELRFNPKLGQRDQMYLNQLNPIVKFTAGYVVWSQLTTQSKASAMQDLNIARLVLYIKRALEQFSINFVFEQNDAVTWGQVAANITEFLETVKKRRGLSSYTVSVGATDYEKKTKTFHVNVELEPVRTAEKIELNFFIE